MRVVWILALLLNGMFSPVLAAESPPTVVRVPLQVTSELSPDGVVGMIALETKSIEDLVIGKTYLLRGINGQKIGIFELQSTSEDRTKAYFKLLRGEVSATLLPAGKVVSALTQFRQELNPTGEKPTASTEPSEPRPKKPKRGYRPDHPSAYLAWSFFTYTETNKPKLTSNHLALGLSYRYEIKPDRLDIWANSDLRLIPLTSQLSEALETDESIQARLIDAGVGLSLQVLPKRRTLGLGLMAGAHYSTMLVTDNRFGYAHFSAPLIGIPIQYTLPTGQELDFEITYAFLRTVDLNYSNSNRRLAIKLSSTSLLTTAESLGLFVHYNNVQLELNGTHLEVNELLGGLSFRW